MSIYVFYYSRLKNNNMNYLSPALFFLPLKYLKSVGFPTLFIENKRLFILITFMSIVAKSELMPINNENVSYLGLGVYYLTFSEVIIKY